MKFMPDLRRKNTHLRSFSSSFMKFSTESVTFIVICLLVMFSCLDLVLCCCWLLCCCFVFVWAGLAELCCSCLFVLVYMEPKIPENYESHGNLAGHFRMRM
ncbi:hypothetical protein P8452_02530 [Trifolium repens]|nr:hypothetical protein P8452_02530 [Trifolium repens]